MENKIITKPYSKDEIIDKSRHLTGIHKWASSSPIIGFFMLVLGWFTIPFEVLFRRDFGQRWLTTINFYAGLTLLSVFGGLEVGYYNTSTTMQEYFSWLGSRNPFANNDPDAKSNALISLAAMFGFIALYILMGLYHLFKIRWRKHANIPQHSFDDGTSRFEWLGYILKFVLNILAFPLLVICWLLIPLSQRRWKPFPKLIYDHYTFTDTVVEPGIAFYMGCALMGVTRTWLFISVFALLIHGHWKAMARKNKMLDFQDSKVEAEFMRELKKQATDAKKHPLAQKSRNSKRKSEKSDYESYIDRLMRSQRSTPPTNPQLPKLNAIIEEMYQEHSQRLN